jgi:dipeptidyl aminopeptidase/acylaminoacyl peptidase
MATPGYEADKERLFLMDLKTKEKKYLTDQFDQSANSMVWNKDGKSIYFISGHKGTFQIYSIETASKNITQITTGDHDYTSLSASGDQLVGSCMSMSMATELFRINPSDSSQTQISFINRNIYDRIKMGKVEAFWVKTVDNKDLHSWVIYPPDFDPGKQYPALLFCEGGPQSPVSQFFSFRWNMQLMAAHGYIVIAPNRRGVPTFGQAWEDEIAGDYGGLNMQDYLSAIDGLKKEPYVDANNLGCVGASYGGYSVFWLAGHHQKRFKAFISHCGMFNFESEYGTTEELWFPNHDLGGPYWKNPKPASYKFSPHLYVQNWDTPILISTGANDFRVPISESMQAFTAAQLLNIPSKLLYFPEESHFILKPQNSILWQREFFKWLDTYLKPASK